MKKIIAGCALLASFAAIATTVESSNTFGVLKVTDSTHSELIIAVPWEKVGGGAIQVTDLVLPTGLEEGDTLYWYSASTTPAGFKSWIIDEYGAWAPNAVTLLQLKGGDQKLPTEGNETITRGEALILMRQNPSTHSDIYLSGQYLDTAGSTTITAGKVTLIAPTTTSQATIDLNDCTFNWGGTQDAAEYDKIMVGIDTVYYFDPTYNDNLGAWYKYTTTGNTTDPITGDPTTPKKEKSYSDVTIPRGQGAWYISKYGAPTITWPTAAANNN